MSAKILTLDDARSKGAGIFSVQDAALFFRATAPEDREPISLWKRRRPRFDRPTSRHLYHWIAQWTDRSLSDDEHERVLDFADLVRLRMIFLLRARGFRLPTIRLIEERAKELTGSLHPFATERLWSNSSDVYVELAHFVISLTRFRQLTMPMMLKYLTPVDHGLHFDPSTDEAVAWNPIPGVLIDPDIQFGAPCIEGTRIETEVIGVLKSSGESVESLARMYSTSVEQIEAALAWEETLAEVA